MLFVVLQVGENRFAIEASQTIEVLPLVEWKTSLHVLPGGFGLFNYHGTPAPIVDLADLIFGRTSRLWMSTRVVIVKDPSGSDGELLGLLAEQVTETKRLDEAEFKTGCLALPEAPYLGAVAITDEGILQRIEIAHLLPDHVRAQLFSRKSIEREAIQQ
jgi:chemotaxis-related protein WspB